VARPEDGNGCLKRHREIPGSAVTQPPGADANG
jgi:hypothetical protein